MAGTSASASAILFGTEFLSLILPGVPSPRLGIERVRVKTLLNAVKRTAFPRTEGVRNAQRGCWVFTKTSTGWVVSEWLNLRKSSAEVVEHSVCLVGVDGPGRSSKLKVSKHEIRLGGQQQVEWALLG